MKQGEDVPGYRAASVRQLAEAVQRVAPRDQTAWEARAPIAGAGGLPVKVSPVRARQLWMVVGMWDRALHREEMPGRARRAASALFTRAALQAFWELAQAGELRALTPGRGTAPELPPATLRIVRDCLGIMAGLVVPKGRPVPLPSVQQPEPKTTVRPESLGTIYARLADMAATGPLERDGTALSYEDRTRLLAMVSLALDAAPRSGELAALRLADLAAGERAVGLRRRQQKAPPNRAEEIAALAEVDPSSVRAVLWGRRNQVSEATFQRIVAAHDQLEPLPEIEWYALRQGTRVAVRRWLEVRRTLVEPLTGGRSALWVTLVPTKAGPPGITLRPQGLTQAFARGITALNWLMAGQYGWEPMPIRMEQLRRAVEVTPLAPNAPGK
ncbi:hypothetical protein [Streptomyces sp. NBC_01304]|uniref:hypothetical protein n=1 Tax=Streptomyces sp. NBC_01304 TaxID=2903818 RepID=UPI002E15A472|nr:hypothetical protein OG430_46400 [Streptomyces sp. NBC_01304]